MSTLFNKKTKSKKKVLIIGPYPPPYGGVATFVDNSLMILMKDPNYEPSLFRIGKKDQGVSDEIQVLIDMVLYIYYVLHILIRKPDIVHIHSASYFSFFRSIPYVIISKILSKAMVLFHIHGAEFKIFYNSSNKIVKYLIAGTLEISDKVIVTSDSWASYIKGIGISNKIYSITNGYDSTIFYRMDREKARNALKINVGEKIILLNVGNLLNYKGHKYLLEAVSILQNRNIDCHLFIIGTGPLDTELKKQCRQLNLEDSITFIGKVESSKDIALFINAADFFVLPSLNEGNPIVMFESMACGKPFIGTKVGGIPDIISDDSYGLLCDSGNACKLADAMLIAINRTWDQQAIALFAQQYSWDNVFVKIIHIYEK